MLVQHVLELLLGMAFESNELEPEPVTPLPSDNGERDDDRRSRTGRFYFETKMRADGEVDVALNFTAGNRKIHHRAMSGPLVSRKQDAIIDCHSWSGPQLHTCCCPLT